MTARAVLLPPAKGRIAGGGDQTTCQHDMAALFIFGSPQERVDALRVVREYVLLQACFPTQLRPFDTVATSEVLQLEDVSSSAVQLFTQSTSLASTLEALDRSIGSDTGMSAGHPAQRAQVQRSR